MPSLGRPAHATFLLRLKGEEGGARLPPAERPAHRVRNLGTLRKVIVLPGFVSNSMDLQSSTSVMLLSPVNCEPGISSPW